MDYYILSRKTQKDIDSIYDYGFHKFGKHQALNYLIELRTYFEILSKNLNIGKQRDEIKKDLFSFPYASHIIFYRVLKNHIRIIRVLHGSRDLRKFLE